ncbi:geranylgeranyl pyrophosphate synthase [Bifidobacterium aemilianum]|uniref:Geranylgeranyl pyrophosphate synthase n=1 Tax=Bifidobacterium aemilianum TaxID=2493120 RepID=A0A366K8E8_9BIFI|nr:polyprenyl synthetase family protein [Bifidobacterium aemilianum]RBP97438.1 geranylgeranyl pyrophosphate synthase [Bifidobacterium aemilianum]
MGDGQRQMLRRGMQRVVERLEAEETSVEPYKDVYRQLLGNHGKMIRASLVLLFARAQDEEGGGSAARPATDQALHASIISGAAAIEMLHLATLVHDDVLDDAAIRRNQPTAHTVVGNKAAIYLGDLILSRYMEIMATIAPSTEFVRQQASTVCEIVGGELLQESARHNTSIRTDYYGRAIRGKTAALFRLASQTGVELAAGVSGANPALLDTAARFGEHLGMAFQIMDDISDFDLAHDSGKPKLEDISEGIYTLPVLLGLEAEPAFAKTLERNDPQLVVDYLQAHPDLIASSKDAARGHLTDAKDLLSKTAINPGTAQLLTSLVDKLTKQL